MIKLKHDQNIRIKWIYIKMWTEFTTRMPILMDWILPTQPKRQHGQMTCAEVQTCLNCQFFETALVQSSIIFPAISNRHSCALWHQTNIIHSKWFMRTHMPHFSLYVAFQNKCRKLHSYTFLNFPIFIIFI